MSDNSKKNMGEKYIAIEENIILHAIEDSYDGAGCAHGRGPACSVKPVTLKKDQLPHIQLNLTKQDLLGVLQIMIAARYSDTKHLMYVKQGKSFFHIGGSGHEATQIAIGKILKPKHDWGWTYYRDLAFCYTLGYTPEEYFLLAFGKPGDPATGGKQMPGHYGHPGLNLPTQSSPTGTQFLNAVGTAMASRKMQTDEITYVSSGEGTTSQGEFYEAVNWASREKLAVLFHIQDNGFAISVPREKQSMGGNVGHSFCCYSSLLMRTYDGTDFFESLIAARQAEEYLRQGKGPVLLHSHVERLLPHSSSDDQRKYRKTEDLESGRESRDCIIKLKNYILKNEIATLQEIDDLEKAVKNKIDEASEWALSEPSARPEDSTRYIFAEDNSRNLNYSAIEPADGNKIVLVDAVNHAVMEEMKMNPKILVFGEDVADPKGGVFTATKGLSAAFGDDRVFNSPLAEASIIGVAVGLAVRGYKPVVEIQFGDYIWPAFMQLKNELATMRYRSNNGFSAPVVVRVAVGGYIHGGLYHSQNIESIFSHIPGLFIAYPSNAADAKGLLKTACRINDPVIFLEHKGMYRLPFAVTPEPDEHYLLPFGKGKIVKRGEDLTIITWGMGVKDSVNAVKKFEKRSGLTAEIIDLRTIAPWDKDLVLNSVKRTGRALAVHEDTLTSGFGAEISAVITGEVFNYLDAPVMRLAAKDSHIPYAQEYENDVLPNEEKVLEMIEKVTSY